MVGEELQWLGTRARPLLAEEDFSLGWPNGALPQGTEASFWVLGRHSTHKLGLAAPRFVISARASALKDTPRGSAGFCFPCTGPGRFPNPEVLRPRPRANGAARGWEGHPGRP